MLCSQIQLKRETPTGEQVKPLPCKSWGCLRCGRLRRKQLIAIAVAGEPNKMLTLTVSPDVGDSPTARRKLLHEAWVKLRKRMARKLGVRHIPYMAFVEKTKRGEPHLHILLRCGYIHYTWYRQQMRQLLKSPVIWIEKIKGTRNAAFYVSKYCTKAPAQFGAMKRYWQSQDYNQSKKEFKEVVRQIFADARVIVGSYIEFEKTHLEQGWAFKEISDGWVDWIHPRQATAPPGYCYYSYNEGHILRTGGRIDCK